MSSVKIKKIETPCKVIILLSFSLSLYIYSRHSTSPFPYLLYQSSFYYSHPSISYFVSYKSIHLFFLFVLLSISQAFSFSSSYTSSNYPLLICATFVLLLIYSFVISLIYVTLHIHLNIFIWTTCNFLSCFSWPLRSVYVQVVRPMW
jgi:hypothetical protein